MRKISRLIFLTTALLLLGSACRSGEKSDLPIVHLKIDGHDVAAEVANNEITRETGLMFRKDMDWNHGMIFVFPDSEVRAFWMKNTVLPLSIAYMNSKGIILNILEMPPETEDTFLSNGQAEYALEMNTGWYAKNGIKPGDTVEGLSSAPVGE
jgi:uncharacterized membrane protein (UPF0127 family)